MNARPTLKKIIGQRITVRLAEINQRQKDLAAYLGIQDNTISYFCSGSRSPNMEQLIKIAEFLNVSTDYLLGVTDNATTNTDLQAVCNYTGLNEKTIEILKKLKSLGKISVLNDIINAPDFPLLIDGVMNYNKAVYKIIDYYSKSHNFTNEDEKNINNAKQYLESQGYIIKPATDVVKSEFDTVTNSFKSLIMNIIATQKEFWDDYNKNVFPKYLKYGEEMYDAEFIVNNEEFYEINKIMDCIHQRIGIKLKVEVYENGKHNPPKE